MNPETYALINIGVALLLAGLSIPLIMRKVPMNSIYGVRFPQSFKSSDAWYEINEYGGKALLISSIPILLSGIYGLVQRPENYSLIGSAILTISVMTACFVSYLRAKKVEKQKG